MKKQILSILMLSLCTFSSLLPENNTPKIVFSVITLSAVATGVYFYYHKTPEIYEESPSEKKGIGNLEIDSSNWPAHFSGKEHSCNRLKQPVDDTQKKEDLLSQPAQPIVTMPEKVEKNIPVEDFYTTLSKRFQENETNKFFESPAFSQ
jgi:hypothetical protein